MRMHIYRLRRDGQPVPPERRRNLAPAYGDLTIELSKEHWAQLVHVARLLVGGTDVIPHLTYVQLVCVRRGMLLRGEEAGRDRHKQAWLCTTAPVLPFEWEDRLDKSEI